MFNGDEHPLAVPAILGFTRFECFDPWPHYTESYFITIFALVTNLYRHCMLQIWGNVVV